MSTPQTPTAPANDGQDVTALRSHLFATLQALRDKDNPMAVDRARAVSEVARTIIETARVEVDAARLMKRSPATPFLGNTPSLPAPAKGTPPLPNGITGIVQHSLRDDDDGDDSGGRP